MERVKVLVHGVLGKMGQEVLSAVCSDPKLEVVAGVDVKASKKEILLPDGTSSIPLSRDLESVLHAVIPTFW